MPPLLPSQLARFTRCSAGPRLKVQHRVLLTVASASVSSHRRIPRSAPLRPSPRSPYQCSHIVHRIRTPTASSTPTAMASQTTQKRTHTGHSHGEHHHHHHHHHDNTYLTSTNKSDPGVRITRIGLYVNLGMAVGKGVGGYVFNSQALTADAVHALSDLISDFMTLATISYSLKPATTRFPLGYGKVESLGALAVSGILLSGGVMIGLQAVMALSQQFFPHIFELLSHTGIFEHAQNHGHDHGHMHLGPNINAAWLAAGSIVVKEWLYRATMKVAKEKRSSVLSSNAYHHRVDSLTAFVALFTIVASHFLESARWLDPVGGLIISGMIVQAGWGNTKSALYELADVGMDDEAREGAEKALETLLVGSDAKIRGVQGIKSGQNLMFEIEAEVPEDWSVPHSNDLEVEIRDAVQQAVRGTRRVNVRFVTKATSHAAFEDQFTKEDRATIEEGQHEDHDHDHDHSHGQSNGHTEKRK
ncbi:Mitochondrial metal transporter 2 [Fulvia fulva]|uniref:Mitochondrial metal transporter 2 n=1 Tax=Passalora fulva TaxID=5499 RepID=A0A9Q8L849_PASFU|nr:Mitochondrial metal transporter 2 [Fulvia fulva]KAK4636208.1 Mitochondrial metal transporter 2 [Fulvia fulva]KAK4636674.1 Mitochondrial metal transporter 2 [Fulvia fulva]UJO12622.1 Mitochondrial metal transporter 2 [Fulvia fulva]WPV08807.1 Mitochondrial metal transporter 2 [Fulvia fulva]WPV23238.1 Mitochondrial metal transporter 2 [Fulvia fulva]